MPTYDKTFLADKAKELHVVRDTLEKVCRLRDILRFFDSSELLRNTLALKGGTAINLLFFNLPRLSVDIDLDFAENLPRADMLETRKRIGELIGKYMASEGYSLSPKTKTPHSLDSLVYEYVNTGGVKDNIKIEINYSLREHVLPLRRMRMQSEIFDGDFEVLTVASEEIYATKTVALLTRAAARDLYDINYMVKYGLFDEAQTEQYRKCVVFYLAVATAVTPLKLDLTAINAIDSHDIKTALGPVIRDLDVFRLEDAKKTVGDYLTQNLSLTAEDLRFLREFKRGRYCPELLFRDEETQTRLKSHPMALWKAARHKEQER